MLVGQLPRLVGTYTKLMGHSPKLVGCFAKFVGYLPKLVGLIAKLVGELAKLANTTGARVEARATRGLRRDDDDIVRRDTATVRQIHRTVGCNRGIAAAGGRRDG